MNADKWVIKVTLKDDVTRQQAEALMGRFCASEGVALVELPPHPVHELLRELDETAERYRGSAEITGSISARAAQVIRGLVKRIEQSQQNCSEKTP